MCNIYPRSVSGGKQYQDSRSYLPTHMQWASCDGRCISPASPQNAIYPSGTATKINKQQWEKVTVISGKMSSVTAVITPILNCLCLFPIKSSASYLDSQIRRFLLIKVTCAERYLVHTCAISQGRHIHMKLWLQDTCSCKVKSGQKCKFRNVVDLAAMNVAFEVLRWCLRDDLMALPFWYWALCRF